MSKSINEQFDAHRKWLNSEIGDGEQLVLDGVNADQLLNEQLMLLTDAILIDCSFEDIQLNENDFYHTEMFDCEFKKVSFCKTQFVKSEINDTTFSDAILDCINLNKAELFDCCFNKCRFKDSSFICTGIWNSTFTDCVLTNIDFDGVYLENLLLINTQIINPINLENAAKITINIGAADSPNVLSHDDSIEWLKRHIIV